MSWHKDTHEKRLDRFEQRILSAQFDSRIVTCRSKAGGSRGSGAGEHEDGDDSLLSLIEDLSRRIDGLERMTTNLSDDLLLGNQRIRRMQSQCTVASMLLLSCALLAVVWVHYTAPSPGVISSTSDDRQDFMQSGRRTHASRVSR